jgi:hypothetical protein
MQLEPSLSSPKSPSSNPTESSTSSYAQHGSVDAESDANVALREIGQDAATATTPHSASGHGLPTQAVNARRLDERLRGLSRPTGAQATDLGRYSGNRVADYERSHLPLAQTIVLASTLPIDGSPGRAPGVGPQLTDLPNG